MIYYTDEKKIHDEKKGEAQRTEAWMKEIANNFRLHFWIVL